MNWPNFQAGNAKQIDQIVTQFWPDTINPHIIGNSELKYPKNRNRNFQISKKEIIANVTKIDSTNGARVAHKFARMHLKNARDESDQLRSISAYGFMRDKESK